MSPQETISQIAGDIAAFLPGMLPLDVVRRLAVVIYEHLEYEGALAYEEETNAEHLVARNAALAQRLQKDLNNLLDPPPTGTGSAFHDAVNEERL